MDDFEGFKTLVEEVIAGIVETARQLELEVESEDVTELLQLTDYELLLTDEQRMWFLERIRGEDAIRLLK